MNRSYSKIRHIQMVNENLEKRKLMENQSGDLGNLLSCLQDKIPSVDWVKNFEGCLALDQTKCIGEITTYVLTHMDVLTKLSDVQKCFEDNSFTFPKQPTTGFPLPGTFPSKP